MKKVMITKKRLLVVLATVVLALSSMGLIFLAPIALIKYASKDNSYEATAEMPMAPEKVYEAAVNLAEEKAPRLKIVKKTDEDMFIEVTDDVQVASVKVEKAKEEGKALITIKATVPKEEGQDKEIHEGKKKELARRVIDTICNKLEVQCTITKGE